MQKTETYKMCYARCESCGDPADLRCEFGILIDELASTTGLLRACIPEDDLREELGFICALFYHISPSLRSGLTATEDDFTRLEQFFRKLEAERRCSAPFVLPMGVEGAALSHILRVKCKAVLRLLYKHQGLGNSVEDLLFDFINLLSGCFFHLAFALNKRASVEEVPFVSRRVEGN